MADKHNFIEADKTDWDGIIKSWETSGQTQKIFCKEHNLIYSAFEYRRSLQREKQRQTQPSFLPAKVKTPTISSSHMSASSCLLEVHLHLPTGVRAKLPWVADKTQLTIWLQALGVNS